LEEECEIAKSGVDLAQAEVQRWRRRPISMKSTAAVLCCLLSLGAPALPVHADAQPTAFEKALYEKARYQVLSKVSDEDLVSYCVSMNVGGDTLLKFHDEILAKQTELANLQSAGLTNDHPQVIAVNAALKDLRSQYAVKIVEVRKALELESNIADATLSSLSQAQR
jgi:hypothetical protein